MRLVYLSPVPWASFEQRPHKFVRWYHQRTGERVLWLEPYPTRFPRPSDLRRIVQRASGGSPVPEWLEVVSTPALPIEPLPGSWMVNGWLWKGLLARVKGFVTDQRALLVFGKPSLLALCLHARMAHCLTLLDVMDDFPSFYEGFSRRAMRRREAEVARVADWVWASSTLLQERWRALRPDALLVRNGLDPDVLPGVQPRAAARPVIFGYVGTVAHWFDWPLLIALAQARPSDVVRIIGPVLSPPPQSLPPNVQMLPPRAHAEALTAMAEFHVGLILFQRNGLTQGVDPIKYYEYRALGLPVLSTRFGEMAARAHEPGVHLVDGISDIVQGAEEAANDTSAVDPGFLPANSWVSRFDQSGLLLSSGPGA